MGTCWHLLTGEYPPQPGGVSDYTALLAAGLYREGEEVHVWTGGSVEDVITESSGVIVHHCAGRWSATDLERLGVELNKFPEQRLLLVQYAPNAWGYRGLNLGFCRWLLKRREAGDDVRLMIHEPFYQWRLRDKPTRWLLAAGQRWMMRTLLAASSQVYVSIPGWEKYVRAYETQARLSVTWLPIFSTIPKVTDDSRVADLRGRLARNDQFVIGSFGTFGGAIAEMLLEILPALLLNRDDRFGLLLGRGGEEFVARLIGSYPQLAGRLFAHGALDAGQVSLHLQTCDLLIQPYPDGVSSRRSSVMAGLAHGIPTVTNTGALSETVWEKTNCVAFTFEYELENFINSVEMFLSDAAARYELSKRARETYDKYFALARTIEKLQL